MPNITGLLAIILTVTDSTKSSSWYRNVFEMEVASEHSSAESHLICLRNVACDLELCLQEFVLGPSETFSEYRAGLDHLEFLVASRADLDEWGDHLDRLGVEHSGVKEPMYSANAMITFRDPDNIQLEFFWPAN
jgi:glyoxylase I family protein